MLNMLADPFGDVPEHSQSRQGSSANEPVIDSAGEPVGLEALRARAFLDMLAAGQLRPGVVHIDFRQHDFPAEPMHRQGFDIRNVRVHDRVRAHPFEVRISGPVKFANLLASRWDLTPAQQASLLGIDSSGEFRLIQLGRMSLPSGQDTRDRLLILSKIAARLDGLVGEDIAVQTIWLREHHLGGEQRPLHSLLTSGRLIDLYNLLDALDEHAAG